MTKKDYVLIAGVLERLKPNGICDQGHRGDAGACTDCVVMQGYETMHGLVCENMADALAKENPLFNRVKFMDEINK